VDLAGETAQPLDAASVAGAMIGMSTVPSAAALVIAVVPAGRAPEKALIVGRHADLDGLGRVGV
jgi:hypothetical protein